MRENNHDRNSNAILAGRNYNLAVDEVNKRAQRALGRSPEEKVKSHSGAIYRGSLMLSTKYW